MANPAKCLRAHEGAPDLSGSDVFLVIGEVVDGELVPKETYLVGHLGEKVHISSPPARTEGKNVING